MNLFKLVEEFDFDGDDLALIAAISTDDEYIETSTGTYRFIHESEIDEIYKEEMIDLLQDCYNLDLPSFIEIDWDKTIENCKADGFGHHFSTYDHSEVFIDGWYIFKTA